MNNPHRFFKGGADKRQYLSESTEQSEEASMFDVIIVGGGPAGLSAALILGRCGRHVLVCDSGQPRNARSSSLHGFLSRDGIPPRELLRIAREQLQPYATVEIRDVEVIDC